jgi:glucose-6-phosphate 1-epimerase
MSREIRDRSAEEGNMDPLNKLFGIEGHVRVSSGRGNLPRVELAFDEGNTAEVYLNGCHVTSWRNQGSEVLFLSQCSHFETGKAIRGGIPLVFPQFGSGLLPQHGFARNNVWTLSSSRLTDAGEVEAVFVLKDSDATRELWDHEFRLECILTLGKQLAMELRVQNIRSDSFEFTTALHTYFAISDIKEVRIDGLKGVEFLDSLKGRERFTELNRSVRFDREVDRVYLQTPDTLQIVDEGGGRRIRIVTTGFPDAVVWNPWIEKAKRMEDFGDDEFPKMVCVEAGFIGKAVSLKSKEVWSGRQTLYVENNPAR